MSDSRWYFTEEQLENSPSRKCGISAELELSYRQRAANLIQEMGQRLQVSQLCINTAIVYMHRFYAFHSFTMFHRNSIAAAAFFLAAKVEEQPRKLEHVIKILNICLEKTDGARELYTEQSQELVLNENILLQTLGFDVAIDHPHTHVVKACQLFNIVTVSRELRQTCYFMASNSLHLTTMCLKYKPTVVAAFCIYIACKWSRWEIPDSSEGKAWYSYVDEMVTLDTLKKLTDEYLQILERSPSKFKSKMKAITTSNGQAGLANALGESSSSHHKNPNHHDKQHHHHHHHRSSNSTSGTGVHQSSSSTGLSASNGSSRKQQYPSGDQKTQMHQPSNAGYKQNVPQQQPSTGSSTSTSAQPHQMHRPRPGPTSSSQAQQQQQPQQQPPYSSSANKSMDERHRHQDPYFNQSQSSQQQRMSDKHRMSLPASGASSSSQGYMKSGSDQKHSVIPNSSNNAKVQPQPPPYTMDIGKNMKQNHNDYHNPRSNPMAQMIQQASLQKKSMPPWQQQPQTLPPLQIPPSASQQQQQQAQQQQQQQMQYMQQKNLQIPPTSTSSSQQQMQSQQQMSSSSSDSAANINNNSISKHQQMMMNSSYGNEIKPTISQNDFWFNDKINEVPVKPPSPLRQSKSLFSPSPEHQDEKTKYMMMTSNIKRESTVDSPKEERKSTPSKREKMTAMSALASNTSQSHKQQMPQVDKKFIKNEIHPPSTVDMAALSQDPIMPNKKRSHQQIAKDENPGNVRSEKMRKVEGVKMESSSRVSQLFDSSSITAPLKQPIETNPDIVKSLLKECYSSNNKFNPYDNDSPLDVINPEPPEELLAVPSSLKIDTHMKREPLAQNLTAPANADSEEKMDSSGGEGHSGKHKKKSKKKKEKHKHKKKHKHSDRESSPPMRLIVSKNSSPESNSAFGGLKIKIPIKDVATAINSHQTPQPAPIKLKISKEKFGSFTNLNNNNSTSSSTIPSTSMSSSSSSSHKKKDKDRDKSKSKSSKHGSDSRESSNYHHHQQHST